MLNSLHYSAYWKPGKENLFILLLKRKGKMEQILFQKSETKVQY